MKPIRPARADLLRKKHGNASRGIIRGFGRTLNRTQAAKVAKIATFCVTPPSCRNRPKGTTELEIGRGRYLYLRTLAYGEETMPAWKAHLCRDVQATTLDW